MIPRLSKKPLKAIALSLIFFMPLVAKADPVFLYAKAGTWTFAVDTPGRATETISGFGAYRAGLGFGLLNNFVFDVAFNVLSSSGIGGQLGFGFDFGIKYYPLTSSGLRTIKEGPLQAEIAEQWRPYVGCGFRQRQFVLVLTSQYVGPGFSVGTDYQLDDRWFLNGEFNYDMLYGQSKVTATQTNIMFGIGREL